jgi:hypothetical protein
MGVHCAGCSKGRVYEALQFYCGCRAYLRVEVGWIEFDWLVEITREFRGGLERDSKQVSRIHLGLFRVE